MFPDPAFVDWNFIMGPGSDWHTLRSQLYHFGQQLPFQQRIPKFTFRGVNSSAARVELLNKFTARTDIADVRPFAWGMQVLPIPVSEHNRSAGYLAPEDSCRYKYILYADGWGVSFRLKYLLMCGSILLTHDVKHKDILLTALKPNEDIYYVGPRWERLEETYRYLESQDQAQLAARARAVTDKVYGFTSDHGLACYIVELLWQYKESVQTWEVEKPNPEQELSLDHFFKMAAPKRDQDSCYDALASCAQVPV
ncbi:hypothetical protein GPECTOR_3g429 [Gonium pectorale]|uniref:Glycosyl transferase CAP10 domain-containing protein n=1 Tax=Gonium pectorale TaxID=33097 RepID=A0A150GZW6_GONPE|nr:hypothetical protein GPECTOR_3g429 [Gonium pectorale]|eukprot:KXZ55293.1 hypothetical protein GPECTOR_3g429 [Gonium pectorale]